MYKKYLLMLGFLTMWNPSFACPTDSSIVGEVEGTIVGIEVRDNCTFLFLANTSTTLPEHDDAPFIAGRFKYLALDPQKGSYNSMLSISSMALATGTKVYAQVTSRLARVDRMSLSKEENNN